MSFHCRATQWPWPVEPGWTREVINGVWVEWNDVRPTAQQVADQFAPSQSVRDNADKQAAKRPDRTPQGRRDRAAYRVLLRAGAKHNALVAMLAGKGVLAPAEAASVRLSVTTLDDFQAAVAAEIDNE